MDHAIHHRLVSGLDPGPHAVDVVRSAGHRLLPSGHDALRVAGLDGLRREHHRLETGATDHVDGDRGNGRRKSGVDLSLAGGRLSRPSLHHLAHDDGLNRGRIDSGTRHGIADDHGSKLRSGK